MDRPTLDFCRIVQKRATKVVAKSPSGTTIKRLTRAQMPPQVARSLKSEHVIRPDKEAFASVATDKRCAFSN